MSCKPTYKGIRYNSLQELYEANEVAYINSETASVQSNKENVAEEKIFTIKNQLSSLPTDSIIDSQIEEILRYTKDTFNNPVLIFKGLDGKTDINGNKFSVHDIPGYSWGSYSYDDALTYARKTGNVAIHIVEGNSISKIKVPGDTPLSKKKEVEEDLIKNTDTDLIELDTIDSTTKTSHILFKNPNEIGVLNLSYPVELKLNTIKSIGSKLVEYKKEKFNELPKNTWESLGNKLTKKYSDITKEKFEKLSEKDQLQLIKCL